MKIDINSMSTEENSESDTDINKIIKIVYNKMNVKY